MIKKDLFLLIKRHIMKNIKFFLNIIDTYEIICQFDYNIISIICRLAANM